jgi:hypothetical protein
MINSHQIAEEALRSGAPITCSTINRILAIYNLHTTEEVLSLLVNLPKFTYHNLSKDLLKDYDFVSKFGKKGQEVPGVYIFTHVETGAKYVGSSVRLATRLYGYFSKGHKEVGKFIPFLYREGLDKFQLEIIPVKSSSIFKAELILEQYYLLNSVFNLNTSRVANIPGDPSKKVFMYNKDKTILLFSSPSFKDLEIKLGIRHAVVIYQIRTGCYYLGEFVFSTVPVVTAKSGGYNEEEIKAMVMKCKEISPLYLYNEDRSVLFFSGLKGDFLKLGIYPSNQGTSAYIDSDSLYLDKYILSTVEELNINYSNLSIEELKESIANAKKAKGITGQPKKVILINVKDNQSLRFSSLTACANYFKGLGYKTAVMTLVSRIESGVEYKGYIVK